MWAFLGLPAPTPVQLDIAYWLQHGPTRAILQAFRGVGKSWITVAFVLWHLLLDPQKKIMVVSANQNLADDFSKFCKQLIHGMPLLQHLAPREGQRDSSVSFDVGPATPSKDPSVKSVGITGQLTGSRADIIVPDDIEVPKNSYTHLLRERLSELVTEFGAILKPTDDARVLFLGTPQVESSLYVKLEDRGYTTRIWPAEIPASPEAYVRKGVNRLASYVLKKIEKGAKPGDPLDPQRFNRTILDERLAEYRKAGYALQFMLDTNPSSAEKHPLKLHDLIVTDIDVDMAPARLMWGRDRTQVIQDLHCGGLDGDYYVSPAHITPEMSRYAGTVMAIDPSGRGKDETGYAIVKVLFSTLFLVDVGGFRDGYSPETLKALAARAGRFKVNWVISEKNYGGGMFDQLLKPYLASVFIDMPDGTQEKLPAGRFDEEYKGWSTGRKEDRILDVLEPVVQTHRLVVDRRILEDDLRIQQETPQYSFVQQFTRMERVKDALPHDDRLEAVAMAVGYWTEKMSLDQQKAHDSHKAKLLDEELRRFKRHAFGRQGPPRYKYAGVKR